MPPTHQLVQIVGTGDPALHVMAQALLDQLAETGTLIDGTILAMSAIARGIVYALASPEWSAGALREAGGTAELITARLASARAFIASYPIELVQEETPCNS